MGNEDQLDENTGMTADSTGPERDAGEDTSRVDEFIDKVGSSLSGGSAALAGNAKSLEKRAHETYSELSESHDALLDELESSMDRSMQELDARYDKEFARLDDETGAGQKSGPEPDTDAQRADRIEARLHECGEKVAILEARLEQSGDQMYKQCAREIESLKEQLAAAHRKLARLTETNEEGWGRIREGLSNIMEDISRTVKSVVSRLKETRPAR